MLFKGYVRNEADSPLGWEEKGKLGAFLSSLLNFHPGVCVYIYEEIKQRLHIAQYSEYQG